MAGNPRRPDRHGGRFHRQARPRHLGPGSAELGERPETRHDDDVCAASVGELLDIIRNLGEELGTVVLVGHNPGLEGLAEALIGDWIPLPMLALAVIELDGPWRSAGRAPELLRAAGRPPTG